MKPFKLVGLFAVALLAIPQIGSSQSKASSGGMSLEDIMHLKKVTNLAISPDGEHIAYTLEVQPEPDKENKPPHTHLYVYNTEKEETTPYYTHSNVFNISFRPDHETVSFITRQDDDKTNGIYEVPLRGGAAKEVFSFDDDPRNIRNYDWANDGEKLAVTAKKDERTSPGEGRIPYNPDIFEEGLTHTRGFILNASEGEPSVEQIEVEGTIYKLNWSPDAEWLAISETPTPLVDDELMFQSVKVIDGQTGELASDIENEGKLEDIQWNPQGDQLALLSGHNIHDPIAGRIMVADAGGGEPENIYPDFEGKFEHIDWSADNEIRFVASESTERSYGTISPDGEDFNYIEETGGPIFKDFAFNEAGNTAFIANTDVHHKEIYLKNDDQEEPKRMTNHNPWLDDREFGAQEVVTYEARDGKEIEGVLIWPVGQEGEEDLPLIVEVHGGPEAHYDNGWLTDYRKPGQEAAAKGYAVFYPNYRGSTGRGIDFIKSSQGDAAGAEFDDVIDGVEYLIDEGIADEDQLAVTGSSYGGYATAWMTTYYSEYFEAGHMNVGVSNKLSKWGTSDIPEELYLVHSREWLWEDNWDKYLDRSPIYHVDNAQTPLLITHGAEDTRVHPAQSMELYRHLDVRKPDLPKRFIRYPQEGHSYVGAKNRYDYNKRMIRWFDSYVKGDEEMPPREVKFDAFE